MTAASLNRRSNSSLGTRRKITASSYLTISHVFRAWLDKYRWFCQYKMAAVLPRKSSLFSLLLVRRSLSVSASLSSNGKGESDPVQKLFLEKLKEFDSKNQQGKVCVYYIHLFNIMLTERKRFGVSWFKLRKKWFYKTVDFYSDSGCRIIAKFIIKNFCEFSIDTSYSSGEYMEEENVMVLCCKNEDFCVF